MPPKFAREEERLGKKKAVELFESGCLDTLEAGTYAALAEIHRHLFGTIYDFAAKMRQVNLAKGNFRFAPLVYLEAALRSIDEMPQSTFDEIVEKYVEMNVTHPFREGNGRSTRIWLDALLKKKLSKEDYLPAMERSPIKAIELKHLPRKAPTDRIRDRALWMRGIDRSYAYEGYAAFRAEDLT